MRGYFDPNGYDAPTEDPDFRVFCLGCEEAVEGLDSGMGDEPPPSCARCRDAVPELAGPAFMETGVDHCPEVREGCAGPDAPWPCNHCQVLSDKANGHERPATVEVPVTPMADIMVFGEGAGL